MTNGVVHRTWNNWSALQEWRTPNFGGRQCSGRKRCCPGEVSERGERRRTEDEKQAAARRTTQMSGRFVGPPASEDEMLRSHPLLVSVNDDRRRGGLPLRALRHQYALGEVSPYQNEVLRAARPPEPSEIQLILKRGQKRVNLIAEMLVCPQG